VAEINDSSFKIGRLSDDMDDFQGEIGTKGFQIAV
jgi:hypothetical protein